MISSLRICQRGLVHMAGQISRRNFMSGHFRCQDVWSKRLSSPILQKVNVNDLFVQLDGRLDDSGSITAVDVDIFANAIVSGDHLDELDDIVHRFRLGTGSHQTLPTTHHAVVRAYLDFGDSSDLLRILDDRLNYGIFPDNYLNILLLDHFIKNGDFTSAAKIASMRMLQEDFDCMLANYMSLYACHKYLLNPGEWAPPAEPVKEDDEEIRVRVAYIRNPFFDDHFDLREPNALVGKTLHYTSRDLGDSIGKNYRALGLILHKKWNEAENFTSAALKENARFNSSIIGLMDNFVGSLPEEEQKALDSVKKVITAARESSIKGDLLAEVTDQIKGLVKTEEKKMIDQQTQAYSDWETLRENVLKFELEEFNKKKRLEEVEKKKKELEEEEQEIFFFDNEDAIDLEIEKKRARLPKSKPKSVISIDYVPPEITVKKSWVE